MRAVARWDLDDEPRPQRRPPSGEPESADDGSRTLSRPFRGCPRCTRRGVGCWAPATARRALRTSSPTRSKRTRYLRSRSCGPPTTGRGLRGARAGCARRSRRCMSTACATSRRGWRPMTCLRRPAWPASGPSDSAAMRSPYGSAPSGSAIVARLPQRDELAVAALVHDVGKLVLDQLYGDNQAGDPRDESPDDRARRERREFGIDHALVGAVLVRRWGLPKIVAAAVERHHAPDATGHAAAIRLADMIVHHAAGDPVAVEAMRMPAAALDLDDKALSGLMFEFPHAGETRVARRSRARSRSARWTRFGAWRGEGLQADRPGPLALGEHRPHPPPQRLQEDRRDRPGAGRAHGSGPRLAIE